MGKAMSFFACGTKPKVNTLVDALEKLEKQFEDVDIMQNIMFDTIDRVCSVDQGKVDRLFQQMEEEVALDLKSQLPTVSSRVL